MDRRSAERALQLARETAHRAVTRAAYLAGVAGLDYAVPAGFPVDLSNIPKVGTSLLAAYPSNRIRQSGSQPPYDTWNGSVAGAWRP